MPAATWVGNRFPPGYISGQRDDPGFDGVHLFSTRHQRFTRVRLPGPHLTESRSAFSRIAHHHCHWATAASGGLGPAPVGRSRGAYPHLSCSKAASIRRLHDYLLEAPSWRTPSHRDTKRIRQLCDYPGGESQGLLTAGAYFPFSSALIEYSGTMSTGTAHGRGNSASSPFHLISQQSPRLICRKPHFPA